MTPRMVPITCHCTLRKLGKKGQFVCDLVKKSRGGGCFFLREGVARGAMFLLSRRGGGIGMGGPLAWGEEEEEEEEEEDLRPSPCWPHD